MGVHPVIPCHGVLAGDRPLRARRWGECRQDSGERPHPRAPASTWASRDRSSRYGQVMARSTASSAVLSPFKPLSSLLDLLSPHSTHRSPAVRSPQVSPPTASQRLHSLLERSPGSGDSGSAARSGDSPTTRAVAGPGSARRARGPAGARVAGSVESAEAEEGGTPPGRGGGAAAAFWEGLSAPPRASAPRSCLCFAVVSCSFVRFLQAPALRVLLFHQPFVSPSSTRRERARLCVVGGVTRVCLRGCFQSLKEGKGKLR